MPNGEPEGHVGRQLEQLVTYPQETLEVEIKTWLDPRDNDDRARIARELIALANHGGGYLILGFEEAGGEWLPSTPRPDNLDSFTSDVINGIVQRYAEPAFHCDAQHVSPQGETTLYPVIVVPSGTTVPIRARRDGPNQRFISKDGYYIRRPGPNSERPRSGRDWDALLHRCLSNRREDLLQDIRRLLTGRPEQREAAPDTQERIEEWMALGLDRWETVCADRLEPDDNRFEHGWWVVAYAVHPPAQLDNLQQLEVALREAHGRETGWPPWWVPTHQDLRPYVYEGTLECWLGETRFEDAAHSDFWKATRNGELILLRGYQEDGHPDQLEPGRFLDLVLPVWRVGECVLHATRFAHAIFNEPDDIEVLMQFRWTGLADRQLTSWANRNRILFGDYTCRQDRLDAQVSFQVGEMPEQLPGVVTSLTQPLYEIFSMFTPPEDMVEAELNRMR